MYAEILSSAKILLHETQLPVGMCDVRVTINGQFTYSFACFQLFAVMMKKLMNDDDGSLATNLNSNDLSAVDHVRCHVSRHHSY